MINRFNQKNLKVCLGIIVVSTIIFVTLVMVSATPSNMSSVNPIGRIWKTMDNKGKEEQDSIDARLWRIERQRKRTPSIDFTNGLNATFATSPFFHRAFHKLTDPHQVTIVTQATVDRLNRVVLMAQRWQGPISTSVLIKNADRDIPKLVELLKKNKSTLAEWVDVHLIFANHTRYPVNNLRNLSIRFAQTDHVLLMDADFVPPMGMNQYIKDYVLLLNNSQEKIAYVVPSFASSEKPETLPNDKESLLEMIQQNKVYPTNLKVCPKCHTPTNYTKWYETNEVYEAKYSWIYEPYLIFNRTRCQPFDERLKGYGFDKNSQVFTMAAEGYRFLVLPEAFIIHINHPTATWEGPSLDEQQWDCLRVVCDSILPTTRQSQGFKPDHRLFDEPTPPECFSDSHW